MFKRLVTFLICLSMFAVTMPAEAFGAENLPVNENLIKQEEVTIGEKGGYLAGNLQSVYTLYEERSFLGPTGHGFAAERANNLTDVLNGKKATVVGGDNVKNGPDRKIINRDGSVTWIQDKYYQTAQKSVDASFDSTTGEYRYIDSNGHTMQLEVPYDQYDEALQQMQSKIKEGKVPGITDPAEAENIVRQGKYTYKQAVNLTKAGNIDSLKYDATNGAVISLCAAGISFTLDFVSCKMNGDDTATALKNSALNGLKTGGTVFAVYVISSQLAKTGLTVALAPTTDALANALGEDVCRAILQAAGQKTAGVTAARIVKNASAVLQKELIVSGVLIVVLTAGDVADLFRGRISKEQLLKNLVVAVVSVGGAAAGSAAGGAIGTALFPGVGTTIGTFAGGILGGAAAGTVGNAVASKVYAGDAEKMYQIISDEFTVLSGEYLISEDEGNAIVETLKKSLEGDRLKKMYASDDRNEYARNLMEPMFEEQVGQREKIILPSETEIRAETLKTMEGVVFLH